MNRKARTLLLGLTSLIVFAMMDDKEAHAQCTLSNIIPVAFGSYDPLAGHLDAAGSFTYRCTYSPSYVGIGITRGSAPTYFPRTLRSGTNVLNYNLYVDAARTGVWGDNQNGTTVIIHYNPQANTNVVLPIYARIFSGQTVPFGSYTDTVVVTLVY